MTNETIRVALIDDQELVRMGLRMMLDPLPDITVVGEASDGRQAIDLARAGGVDVMLMDVRMPGVDGIAATEAITAASGAPRVLVLTTFDLDEYAFGALRAGASGFLLKDARPEDLFGAIRAVHSGDAALAPRVTARMIERFVDAPAPRAEQDPLLETLTPREREILVAIGEGLSNDELAERFFLSVSTVKTHIGRLLQKLGARDRVQLVIRSYEWGLVG
ncbi:response regulator [Microbacterium karelineae]|uniref:response regulator n=1 Tax=Microbacterium karelineae TaxID=2654283 RepID=UPI0012EA46CC|nr:response regulator transcription factor [Microbacterium karelineae]